MKMHRWIDHRINNVSLENRWGEFHFLLSKCVFLLLMQCRQFCWYKGWFAAICRDKSSDVGNFSWTGVWPEEVESQSNDTVEIHGCNAVSVDFNKTDILRLNFFYCASASTVKTLIYNGKNYRCVHTKTSSHAKEKQSFSNVHHEGTVTERHVWPDNPQRH